MKPSRKPKANPSPLADAAPARSGTAAWLSVTVVLLAAITLFYLLTIRDGQAWGDDFAMYIRHAQNIVEGVSYADTGYIYNPHEPKVGPRVYPPGFPVMLAPVCYFWGLNLYAMKVETVLCFGAFLGAFFLVARRRLSPPYAAVAVAIIGLNPYFWQFKDNILSDIAFALLLYVTFHFISRSEEDGARNSVWQGALIGLLIYMTYSVRTVGIVLLPAVVVMGFLRGRRSVHFTMAILLVVGALIGLQVLMLSGLGSYRDQLRFDGDWILRNLRLTALSLSTFWMGVSGLAELLTLLMTGLAVYGYARAVRRPALIELFVPFYCLALIPADNQGLRFLIPLLPLYVLYALQTVERLRQAQWVRHKGIHQAAVGALLLCIFSSFALSYSRKDFGPIREGVATPEAQELFRYLREETPKDSVMIFHKPRALALYTGRRASANFDAPDGLEALAYMRKIGATHVVVDPDTRYLKVLVPCLPRNFLPVFHNAQYDVYRIHYTENR